MKKNNSSHSKERHSAEKMLLFFHQSAKHGFNFFTKVRKMSFLLAETTHSSIDFFGKPPLFVTFEIGFTQKLSHLTPLVFPCSRRNCTDFQRNCLLVARTSQNPG